MAQSDAGDLNLPSFCIASSAHDQIVGRVTRNIALILLVLATPGALRAAAIDALTFTPDGKAIVFNGHKALKIQSIGGGKAAAVPCSFAKITDLAFSPDGKTLAIAGGLAGSSGGFRIIKWQNRDEIARHDDFDDIATAIAFHPTASAIAVASADRSVAIYGFKQGRPSERAVHKLSDHSRAVLDVAYTPDGKRLVTSSADRSLKVWNPETGKLLRSFGNHTEIVHALAMRPPVVFAGRTLPAYCASGSDDQTVRIWQPGIGRMVRIVRYHDGPIFALVWQPDGARLLTVGKEGLIRLIDGDSDEVLGKWPAHDDWVYSLAISPDGRLLASGDWSGEVKLWQIEKDGLQLLRKVK